jgi:chromosome segregation ATPase
MRANLGETTESRGPQKQISYLPEAPVVDRNNDKAIHKHHELIDEVKKELGMLKSDIHKFKVKIGQKVNDCRTQPAVKVAQMHGQKKKARHTQEELQHVTCQCEELIITYRKNRLTVVNLQNKIDKLVAELKSVREAYEADLNQEKRNHIMTKDQCRNLNAAIRNTMDSYVAVQKRLTGSESYVEELKNANKNIEAQKAALEEQVQVLTEKLDQQHETEKLSARLCELTATLSAVQKRNTDHQHEIEALHQKLDHQRQCAMVTEQQIATLQDQVLALTVELEHEKNASQKARDHIAVLAAEKENRDKIICVLVSALPPAV